MLFIPFTDNAMHVHFHCRWHKAGYTLVTKSNSTWSTLSTFDKVDCVALALYPLVTKSKGRSTFKNHAISTKSTELNMFNFGDNVNRDKLSNSTLSPVGTDGRQSRNFMNINEDRLVKVTVACATSNRDPTCLTASATVPCSNYRCNGQNWRQNHIFVCHCIKMTSLVTGSITWLINIQVVADLSPFCRQLTIAKTGDFVTSVYRA